MMQRAVKDFLGKSAPPGYIAGLGRGYKHDEFMTALGQRDLQRDRIWVQHARWASIERTTPAYTSPVRREGALPHEEREEPSQNDDPDNEFGLFNSLPYERDDEEADRLYDYVEQRMDERRKRQREEQEHEALKKYRKERPKIQQQFADLKRALTDVSMQEWEALPEAGDLVGRHRKKQSTREYYSAIPDALLDRARESVAFDTSVHDGNTTPAGNMTNFREIGQARDMVLGLKLDRLSSDSASGKTTVDPKGYLTDLNSMVIKSTAEISDIKKARQLLKSVINTNPKHAPGWIAAARLEEVDGKLVKAREIIQEGCTQCPKDEDVWLEAVRLNTIDNAKTILRQAVNHLPTSVKLWLQAAKLEADEEGQKRVYFTALESVPESERLWKALISLEQQPKDAILLLGRATELCPASVELWLALARTETPQNARVVLNNARKAIPTSHEIWIAAARLEEHTGDPTRPEALIKLALTRLAKQSVFLTREQWIHEAETCEQQGSLKTCHAIVQCCISIGVDEQDREHTWIADYEACVVRSSIETARAILGHILSTFPTEEDLWMRAVTLEKDHGTFDTLQARLKEATKQLPHVDVFWLMHAKEQWLHGDEDRARAILLSAFHANPDSEAIWLAAVKLESSTGHYDRARDLLVRAREQADTERVWMKSCVLERISGQHQEAKRLVDVALQKFPRFDKLWMIKAQLEEEDGGDVHAAQTALANGIRNCPESVALWILASRLEERASNTAIKARTLLDAARKRIPKNELLWREAVQLELRAGNANVAKANLATALQECPQSGALWSDAILMEPRTQRRAKSMDALKRCDHDARVVCTVARVFWMERKLDKARNWFDKAAKLDADYGDAWAYWYKFEHEHGNEAQQEHVVRKCIAAEPRHGDVWPRIAKSTTNAGMSIQDVLARVANEFTD